MDVLPDIEQLCDIVATVAAEELLPRFRHVERCFKSDGSIVTEADLAMQQGLKEALQERWPEIALLGEEMTPLEQQTLLEGSSPGLWVLDPLDGTSNFATGVPYFSVSLALLIEGGPVLGVVYDTVRDECFSAISGGGSRLNGEPIQPVTSAPPLEQSTALIDFKRLSSELACHLAAKPPYSSQRSFGSVALDWCYLACGRGHLYLHGRQKLWDYAAGWLVASEAGVSSSTLEGEAFWPAALTPVSAVAAVNSDSFRAWRNYIDEST